MLTGLRSRGGLLVDAIGLLCRPVAADGTLGSQSTVGTLAGGGGGTSGTISCAIGAVAYHANISHGSYVNGVSLTCKPWNAAKREVLGQAASAGSTKGSLTGTNNHEICEAAKQPMVGIRGRASGLVDAIGFICDEP